MCAINDDVFYGAGSILRFRRLCGRILCCRRDRVAVPCRLGTLWRIRQLLRSVSNRPLYLHEVLGCTDKEYAPLQSVQPDQDPV
jgi:hypothetical protein